MLEHLRDWLRDRRLAGFTPPPPRLARTGPARHAEELRDVRRYLDSLESEVDALTGRRRCPPREGRREEGDR